VPEGGLVWAALATAFWSCASILSAQHINLEIRLNYVQEAGLSVSQLSSRMWTTLMILGSRVSSWIPRESYNSSFIVFGNDGRRVAVFGKLSNGTGRYSLHRLLPT